MSSSARHPVRFYYGFVVVGVVFTTLLLAAGVRGAPSLLLEPLEQSFGWTRTQTSLAAAVGIFLYGLVGPFAAALMQTVGVRPVVTIAICTIALAIGSSVFMTEYWQLILTWGVLSGIGCGCVTMALGATVVNRWFVSRRGLMMGLVSASTATGALLFIPTLAQLLQAHGWKPAVLAIAGCALGLAPIAYGLLREHPADLKLLPYGATAPAQPVPPPERPFHSAVRVLWRATRQRDFWLLFGTFFVCGATTNGLLGTHMIALCGDYGIPEVRAAKLLAAMGIFDLIGTTASGWLTDRYDPRKLLFMYYGLRGLSLVWLSQSDFSLYGLSAFSVFYGLDWVATVPPTARLTNETFGDASAPVVFAWIFTGHQIGAATAAMVAGSLRTLQGNYSQALIIAGITGLVAAVLALCIGSRTEPKLAPALPTVPR